MADLNPMEPGDVPYPQYSVVTTIKGHDTNDTFTKGRIYTMNSNGFVTDVVATLATGLVQCMGTFQTFSGSSDETGQFLGVRSRMILIASENIHLGSDVDTVVGTDTVAVSTDPLLKIGKVFEIYTRSADGTKKSLAVNGDKVIVETVGP